jgi:DNA processing protein
MKSIQFKVLQRKMKFRNPNHLLEIPESFSCERSLFLEAEKYIQQLRQKNINFTYPGHEFYPAAFLKMKEPPLFLEYRGQPFWTQWPFLSVIGSRELSSLTEKWMKTHLVGFVENSRLGIVSGGARGVDQLAHLLTLKGQRPTIFVLPSGIQQMYPENLRLFESPEFSQQACFLSEFESDQKIHKSHFYFRNRLIAALGEMTLVAQASLKSGSLLTVHHCLENGKPVLVIPAHPELFGFDGNIKLVREGAFPVSTQQDLLDFWNAEFQTK